MGLSVSLGKLIPRAKLLLGGVSFYSVYNTVTCELIDLYYVGDGGSMEPTLSVGDIVWVRPVGTGHYLSDLLYYFGLPTALTYQDIRVGDVVVSNQKLHMVFEFLDKDLKKHMDDTDPNVHNAGLPAPLVKSYMSQLLDGIAYCHAHQVI